MACNIFFSFRVCSTCFSLTTCGKEPLSNMQFNYILHNPKILHDRQYNHGKNTSSDKISLPHTLYEKGYTLLFQNCLSQTPLAPGTTELGGGREIRRSWIICILTVCIEGLHIVSSEKLQSILERVSSVNVLRLTIGFIAEKNVIECAGLFICVCDYTPTHRCICRLRCEYILHTQNNL